MTGEAAHFWYFPRDPPLREPLNAFAGSLFAELGF